MDIGRPRRTYTIEADHLAAAGARDTVRHALRDGGWGTEAAEHVVLAFCEALTNAIEHGSVPGAPVEVEIAATADRAVVRVTDRGRPGRARPVRVPRLPPSSAEHGRGLNIMGALADGLEIRTAGRGTEVRLEFIHPRIRAGSRTPVPA